MDEILIGFAPTRRSIFSAPDAVKYSESISVYDATQIWLSNGKDEDYTFGYSEEELENALS